MLNKRLLISQKVSPEQEKQIIDLHHKIDSMFTLADDLIREDLLNPDMAQLISEAVEEYEFKLQKNWNFEQDRTKHTHWYRIPGCTCAKMDQEDLWGTEQRWINQDCPFHNIKEKNNE